MKGGHHMITDQDIQEVRELEIEIEQLESKILPESNAGFLDM